MGGHWPLGFEVVNFWVSGSSGVLGLLQVWGFRSGVTGFVCFHAPRGLDMWLWDFGLSLLGVVVLSLRLALVAC